MYHPIYLLKLFWLSFFLVKGLYAGSNHCSAVPPFIRPGGINPICGAKPLPALRQVIPPLLSTKGVIMLDPGHGGHDIGTQSLTKPRYQEKALNLTTARFVKKYLEDYGYTVYMTRHKDVFVSLDKRSGLANKKRSDLFVSLHYNSAPSAEARGIEIFYYPSRQDKKRAQKSKALAQLILKYLLMQVNVASRGVKSGNWAVIRETKMPAILVEGGFMTNETEMNKLKDPDYLKQLAWAIARGINAYMDLHCKSP